MFKLAGAEDSEILTQASLKWRKEEAPPSASAADDAEGEVVTDMIVDQLVDMISETKNHFKRWKF